VQSLAWATVWVFVESGELLEVVSGVNTPRELLACMSSPCTCIHASLLHCNQPIANKDIGIQPHHRPSVFPRKRRMQMRYAMRGYIICAELVNSFHMFGRNSPTLSCAGGCISEYLLTSEALAERRPLSSHQVLARLQEHFHECLCA